MSRKLRKRLSIIIACVMVFAVISACSKDTTEEPMKVVYGDAGWDSMKFHNAVAILIGEAAYNIEGEVMSGSTAITYGAVKTGDIQVYMETWTDNIATYAEDIAEGTVIELSLNYADNAQGPVCAPLCNRRRCRKRY